MIKYYLIIFKGKGNRKMMINRAHKMDHVHSDIRSRFTLNFKRLSNRVLMHSNLINNEGYCKLQRPFLAFRKKLIILSKNFQNGLTNRRMGGKIKQLQKPFFVKFLSTRRPLSFQVFLLCAQAASRRLRTLVPHVPP